MQKVKDFIYYNRKDIVIVIVMLLLFLSYVFLTSSEKEYVDDSLEEEIVVDKLDEEKKEEEEVTTNFIVIDIKGEVNNPGTYKFDEEKRVIDVINEAGGLTTKANTSSINLSEKIYDEMVIVVPSFSDEVKEDNLEFNTSVKKDSKISINTASLSELITINGIGESKAKSIIDYREKNGKFKSIEEIKNVSGIGNSTFDKIKDFIKI